MAALQGATDEYLSKEADKRIKGLRHLETGEVSKYIQSKGLEGALSKAIGNNPDDMSFTLELIDGVVERAAFYISVCITGTLVRGNRKDNKPTCIMVEGGVYEKLPGFKQKIGEVLKEYIKSVADMLPGDIKYEFTTGENTTLFGTALAGL